MKNINAGIKGEAALKVSENELAVNVGSGSLEVFATPVMVMLMEKAACSCVASYMENDETTVGTEMNVKHLSASPAGSDIRAEAELTEVNGRELVFSVKAYDNCGLIGEGTHKRFLVFGERFTEKAKAKLQ
ncbi:MAG: thioesterase family protein [Ruminococcus sp.]|nr:thioesterase family protein [Ruminococcus sp.]